MLHPGPRGKRCNTQTVYTENNAGLLSSEQRTYILNTQEGKEKKRKERKRKARDMKAHETHTTRAPRPYVAHDMAGATSDASLFHHHYTITITCHESPALPPVDGSQKLTIFWPNLALFCTCAPMALKYLYVKLTYRSG